MNNIITNTNVFFSDRINVGCGQTPTKGWYNCDNSFSIRLANRPILCNILDKFNLLQEAQKDFIKFAKQNNIIIADATKKLPFPDSSMSVVYSSHMLEHLDKEQAKLFLSEAYRILIPKTGILRIVVPDIKILVDRYIADGDANALIANTSLTHVTPNGIASKLIYLLNGGREHKWMYDGRSLVHLLARMNFKSPEVVPAGQTFIPNPGGLDLYERVSQSVYVEAFK